jgi:hypothetical protein
MKYITTPEARFAKDKPTTMCYDCPEDPRACGNPCPHDGAPCPQDYNVTLCADCSEDASFCGGNEY